MLKGGENPSGNTWARACDTCRSSPCRVYCRADAAYLCSACDARVHAANQVSSRHERVWVCESCERSPAAFLCKADFASLCPDCDAHVHSANPLARRHHRLPILPLSFHHSGGRRAGPFPIAEAGDDFDDEDEDEAASWLLLNPFSNTNNNKGHKINNDDDNNHNGCIVGGEADEYLDMVEYTSGTVDDNSQLCDEPYNYHGSRGPPYDSVVPNGTGEGKEVDDRQNNQMGVDSYDIKSGYEAYNNSSISHNVSVLSLDVCTVPEPTMSDNSTSNPWPRPPKGTIDLFSDPPVQQMPTQLSPTDRHARVMRYREKKKTRKFEKTIRYASRKAYAETRPRIKGRFARRSEVEVEVDQMFPNAVMADGGYGIVPSF